jgi:hypothetical protein
MYMQMQKDNAASNLETAKNFYREQLVERDAQIEEYKAQLVESGEQIKQFKAQLAGGVLMEGNLSVEQQLAVAQDDLVKAKEELLEAGEEIRGLEARCAELKLEMQEVIKTGGGEAAKLEIQRLETYIKDTSHWKVFHDKSYDTIRENDQTIYVLKSKVAELEATNKEHAGVEGLKAELAASKVELAEAADLAHKNEGEATRFRHLFNNSKAEVAALTAELNELRQSSTDTVEVRALKSDLWKADEEIKKSVLRYEKFKTASGQQVCDPDF